MRRTLLLGTMLVAAGFFSLSLARGELERCRQSHLRARIDWLECERMAQGLLSETGESIPSNQASMTRKLTDVAPAIEKAASGAGIPPSAIVIIEPGSLSQNRRKDGKAELAVHVELENVTLAPIGQFLRGLESPAAGFRVQRLRFSAPRSASASSEQWNSELSLTCWIEEATSVRKEEK